MFAARHFVAFWILPLGVFAALEFNPGHEQTPDPNFGLPRTETTLAESLKTMGYATGMSGKWHLGFRPALQPPRRGFDEFFGFLGGAHQYLNPQREIILVRRGTTTVQEL